MTAFGNEGHVLTNTGQNANQTTENYTCISAPTNGPYLYKLDNTTGNRNIEYNVSSNAWNANPSTDGNHDPSNFLSAGSNGSSIITPTNANTALHIGYGTTSTVWIASYSVDYSSGPTVTSITSGYIVTDDTVTTTDFTLLKNGSAYANTNISLTAATITLPSDAQVAGYTYNLTYDGTAFYTRTVDSKTYSDFYYDSSWTSSPTSGRSTNSNRILNVIGTIPSGTAITSDITLVLSGFSDRHIHYGNYDNILSGPTKQYGFYVTGNASDVVGYFYYYPTGFIGSVQYSSPFTIGDQETMSFTAGGHTVNLIDWVYSNEPEGDGYIAPVTTTSNGGGRPDRYPLIMTNLFNRNRSLYSIGMTHKDTWDLFL